MSPLTPAQVRPGNPQFQSDDELVGEAPPTTPERWDMGQTDGTSSDSSSDWLSAVDGRSSPSSRSPSASAGGITEQKREDSRRFQRLGGFHRDPSRDHSSYHTSLVCFMLASLTC